MANAKEKVEIAPVTITVSDIGNLIYTIRDKQVVLDHDLAALYVINAHECVNAEQRDIGANVAMNRNRLYTAIPVAMLWSGLLSLVKE